MATTADEIKQRIFNAALAEAEAPRVSNLRQTGDTSLQACLDMFPSVFDTLMEQYDWGWATERVQLTKDTAEPIGDTWETQFSLPEDFLRMLKVDTAGVTPWVIEGQKLLTKYDGKIVLVYVAEKDLTHTSAIFRRLCELRMGSRLALRLSKNRPLSMAIEQRILPVHLDALRETTTGRQEPAPLTYKAPEMRTEPDHDPRRG